jgi:hypothetical protein
MHVQSALQSVWYHESINGGVAPSRLRIARGRSQSMRLLCSHRFFRCTQNSQMTGLFSMLVSVRKLTSAKQRLLAAGVCLQASTFGRKQPSGVKDSSTHAIQLLTEWDGHLLPYNHLPSPVILRTPRMTGISRLGTAF